MEFAERYARALTVSTASTAAIASGGNGGRRRQADMLAAAGFVARETGDDIGALLYRVKYLEQSQGSARDGSAGQAAGKSLGALLRLWTAEVTRRGRAHRWVAEAAPWDAHAAQRLYRTVAEVSLAHWLDPRCPACGGTGRAGADGRAAYAACAACAACAGSGEAPLACGGGLVRSRARDMGRELERIAARHARLVRRRLDGD